MAPLGLVLAACVGGASGGSGLVVVASTTVLADFVAQVGGDRVQVSSLLPPGADPHTVEPTPRDVAALVGADLVVVNGLGLEESIEGALDQVRDEGVPVVALAEEIDADVLEGGEDGHDGAGNPHLWLDVRYAMAYVERIRDALVAADPEHAAQYRENAAAYLTELEALDGEFAAAMEQIPPERRKLVTFHDAFPYLARRYGLEVVGVILPSPGREPSARELAMLRDAIVAAGVPAVYKEPQLNARVLELLAADLGVEVRELYSDAVAGEVESYVAMMRHNLRQLVEGLGRAG